MLSDSTIDNLITPLVIRQRKLNLYILNLIAERLELTGHLSQSDLYRLDRLYQTGSDTRKIVKALSDATGYNVKDIKEIIKEAAISNYMDTKPYFEASGKPFIPYAENFALQMYVQGVARATAETYANYAKTGAFMIRDRMNPNILIPTPVSLVYQNVIDEAVSRVSLGTTDYNSEIRKTLEQLIDSGLRSVTYDSATGKRRTYRLDSVVRRTILDGIKQVNQGVQDITGEQFKADGKEVTAHSYPAPDHAPCQGHIFTNENYERLNEYEDVPDINGRIIPGFKRKITTCNCKHFAYSIIIGVSSPRYTQDQLDAILKENQRGFTDSNGKHYTGYECTQKQREYELRIRYAKDGQIIARASGDEELSKNYQTKVNNLTAQYVAFSKASGFSVKTKRMAVAGYRKVKV